MLRALALTDYRNVREAHIPLCEGFNVFVGPNGAGKTNLLEAVYILATLRSFRTTDAATLIHRAASSARIAGEVEDPVAGVPTTLEVRFERRGEGARRSAFADGKSVRRATDFYGRLHAILFTPDDLAVLRGGPRGRRELVDRVIFAVDRAHISDVTAYEKAVRSRNRVLREELPPGQRTPLLDSYDSKIAEVGARIWARRVEVLEELCPRFVAGFTDIHGAGAEAGLRYVARLEAREGKVAPDEWRNALLDALARRRDLDLARKTTTVGPHRDEVEVTLDGVVAGSYASQGQTRALMMAFKLAELRSASTRHEVAPLLLLDDVSSELDPVRSAQLFAALAADAGQCLLTTTETRFAALPETAIRQEFVVSAGTVAPAPEKSDK